MALGGEHDWRLCRAKQGHEPPKKTGVAKGEITSGARDTGRLVGPPEARGHRGPQSRLLGDRRGPRLEHRHADLNAAGRSMPGDERSRCRPCVAVKLPWAFSRRLGARSMTDQALRGPVRKAVLPVSARVSCRRPRRSPRRSQGDAGDHRQAADRVFGRARGDDGRACAQDHQGTGRLTFRYGQPGLFHR